MAGRTKTASSEPTNGDGPMTFGLTLTPAMFDELVRRVAATLADERADDGFLDVRGAADFLSCGVDRIYALVSAGRIPVHRDGRRLLFDRTALREWVVDGGALRP
jgi:excisionase family DNA binding protein